MNSHFKRRYSKFKVTKFTKKALVPKNSIVELTNGCNHACVFCHNPEMKRKISFLDLNVFEKFVKKAISEGVEEFGLYATGEPFFVKNLEEYISIAKKNGAKRVYCTSNGALANIAKVKKCILSGLDSIKFSINAGTADSYKIIHGFDDFDKVINNVKEIYEFKTKEAKNFQLLCGFVYTNLTKNEVEGFKKKYLKYFDDIEVHEAYNQGGRTLNKSKNLNSDFNKIKTKKHEPCEMLWNRLHLTAEGYLTACCVDYENDLVYSKFENDKTLENQFNSGDMINLRLKHINNNLEGSICDGCIHNNNNTYSKLNKTEEKVSKINHLKVENLKERIKKASKEISN
tara:strand:- start:123 stop:1151 length:1029 start_codon:yes stop_codon:yes gene_type:complete